MFMDSHYAQSRFRIRPPGSAPRLTVRVHPNRAGGCLGAGVSGMTMNAPWLSLSSDWLHSPIFDGLGDDERYLWILLLTHCKAHGRGGRVKCDHACLVRHYRTTANPAAWERLVAAAVADGAVTCHEDGTLLVRNWDAYQNKRPKPPLSPQSPQIPQRTQSPLPSPSPTTFTNHQPPMTHHQTWMLRILLRRGEGRVRSLLPTAFG